MREANRGLLAAPRESAVLPWNRGAAQRKPFGKFATPRSPYSREEKGMKKLLIAIAIVALTPIAQATNHNHPSWQSHNWSQNSWFIDWFKTKWNKFQGCGRD
jgi:hypothetical protein